jgi:hypothetical protein
LMRLTGSRRYAERAMTLQPTSTRGTSAIAASTAGVVVLGVTAALVGIGSHDAGGAWA